MGYGCIEYASKCMAIWQQGKYSMRNTRAPMLMVEGLVVLVSMNEVVMRVLGNVAMPSRKCVVCYA
eukprot:459088-Amorphochlora_amoeboformis.AAC.1